MGLPTIIFLTGMMLTLTLAQFDCKQRLYTCADVFTRGSYTETERDDFLNCLKPINCSQDVDGQALRQSLMDNIYNTPISIQTSDGSSTTCLSLVLCVICMLLWLSR